jgi:hypothetical protein
MFYILVNYILVCMQSCTFSHSLVSSSKEKHIHADSMASSAARAGVIIHEASHVFGDTGDYISNDYTMIRGSEQFALLSNNERDWMRVILKNRELNLRRTGFFCFYTHHRTLRA